jgi:hypothetical protein
MLKHNILTSCVFPPDEIKEIISDSDKNTIFL